MSANVPDEDLRVIEEQLKRPEAPVAPISGVKDNSFDREDVDGITSSHQQSSKIEEEIQDRQSCSSSDRDDLGFSAQAT
jgi:hypothetical protein